ncbi:hypothetical protein E8E13_004143 [Curvularia kusanoi]|uniref:Uncharacterized protein n=1 Tax=Curvularia kusanoi TaxID=90978 RepID=A0A9P4T5Z7_CURKU|nr:hypothetical protein E8E13_004143 [Curvularia kusanoi]
MFQSVHNEQPCVAKDARVISNIAPVELVLGVTSSITLPIILILVDILYRLLRRAYHRLQKMQVDNARTFPFEALPQELRDMVYSNLLEDIYYPSPATCKPTSALTGVFTGLWGSATSSRRASQARQPSNWILLSNKQIHAEYMDMVCKQGTFNLTVSPENYLPPTKNGKIWSIDPATFKNIRKASLEIVTTSTMLGCTDPRNMESLTWELAARIRSELCLLESCKQLTLNAKAIGDPLWNPLWIWYHSSQSFRDIGTSLSDHPTGPKLNKITFSLDTWSPGENYLERDQSNKGAWSWYCMEGHSVGLDGGSEQTVRDFCGMLYRECRTCRPAEEDEED